MGAAELIEVSTPMLIDKNIEFSHRAGFIQSLLPEFLEELEQRVTFIFAQFVEGVR